METNLPSCFSIQFLEQLLKFLVNFTLLKYVKSQRNYGFLITKELTFDFQILDLKDHFSASLKQNKSGNKRNLQVLWVGFGYEMKVSILSDDSSRKTGNKVIDRFLIPFLVPDITTLKSANGTKNWRNYPRNFGERN